MVWLDGSPRRTPIFCALPLKAFGEFRGSVQTAMLPTHEAGILLAVGYRDSHPALGEILKCNVENGGLASHAISPFRGSHCLWRLKFDELGENRVRHFFLQLLIEQVDSGRPFANAVFFVGAAGHTDPRFLVRLRNYPNVGYPKLVGNGDCCEGAQISRVADRLDRFDSDHVLVFS
jgi:hypothetical protein